MSYGLTNALAAFIGLMNRVFEDYLIKIVVVFIDDILVHSKTKGEHEEHFRAVLERLPKAFYEKFKKCEFRLENVSFLGLMASKERISVDPTKIEQLIHGISPRRSRKLVVSWA